MSEYEAYWLGFSTNNLSGAGQKIIMVIKKNKQYKKKLVIIQSIGIIVMKTRVIIYTYRSHII